MQPGLSAYAVHFYRPAEDIPLLFRLPVIVKKDDLIIVPKGLRRGVKALTELSLLHVVQPPPADTEHNEVHRKLGEGIFD